MTDTSSLKVSSLEEASKALHKAEVHYLLVNGWCQELNAYRRRDGELEDRWSFPALMHRNKYQGITQGHAVNAQKALSRLTRVKLADMKEAVDRES